jgi:hypothetical protein
LKGKLIAPIVQQMVLFPLGIHLGTEGLVQTAVCSIPEQGGKSKAAKRFKTVIRAKLL